LGREAESDAIVDRAREDFGDAPEIVLLLARRSIRKGALAEAESALLPLATAHDDHARAAWSWIATARLARSDLSGAFEAAEQTFSLDRDDPVATYVVAMALRAKKDRRALAWLERAHLLSPQNQVLSSELEKARSEAKTR